MIRLWSGPPGLTVGTYVAPAFQNWFAVEFSYCFISVMNLHLYVRCFDSLMSRGPSNGPNNFYVYMSLVKTNRTASILQLNPVILASLREYSNSFLY